MSVTPTSEGSAANEASLSEYLVNALWASSSSALARGAKVPETVLGSRESMVSVTSLSITLRSSWRDWITVLKSPRAEDMAGVGLPGPRGPLS